MSRDADRPIEERRARAVERAISDILRGGVLTSLALVTVGIVLTFVHHPEYLVDGASVDVLLRSGTLAAPSLAAIPGGLLALEGRSFVAAGLLVLILTPALRVAASIVGFAVQRDRVYVAITTIVLVVLITSFLLGKAGA